MTTAIDSNVLLDVLLPDPNYVGQSARALSLAAQSGPAVVAEPVYGEIANLFNSSQEADTVLESLGVRFLPSTRAVLYAAGLAWRYYTQRRPMNLTCPSCGSDVAVNCPSCGERIRARQHLMSDFLIGAHAMQHADRLLTRDRGYYSTYFPDLELA